MVMKNQGRALNLTVTPKVVSGAKNLPFHGYYPGRPELLTLASVLVLLWVLTLVSAFGVGSVWADGDQVGLTAAERRLLAELERQGMWELYGRFVADHRNRIDEVVALKGQLYGLESAEKRGGLNAEQRGEIHEQLLGLYDRMIALRLKGFDAAGVDRGRVDAEAVIAVAEGMLASQDIDMIGWLLERARILLLRQGWGNYLQLELSQSAGLPCESGVLANALRTAERELDFSGRLIEYLVLYLDRYSGADWLERFGETGFYGRLERHRQRFEFLQAVGRYYEAFLGRLADDGKGGAVHCDGLKGSLRCLSEQLERGEEASEDLSTALWRLRIGRLLAGAEHQYVEAVRGWAADMLARSLPVDLAFEVRLESLRCGLAGDGGGAEAIGELEDWLAEQGGRMSNRAIALLRLKLLTMGSGQSPVAFFRELVGQTPALAEVSGQLLAGYLAWGYEEVLAGSEPLGDAERAAYFKGWADFELLGLIGYYQGQGEEAPGKLLPVCEAFLSSRGHGHDRYADVLYAAGRGHFDAGRQLQQKGDDEAFEQYVAAVTCWNELVERYPGWVSSMSGDEVDSQTVAGQGAWLAWQLFEHDSGRYHQLAYDTLSGLVGRIDGEGGVWAGPWSRSALAVSYRYYLGYVMMVREQYALAAKVFAAVAASDAQVAAARYYAIYCEFNALSPAAAGNESSSEVVSADYSGLIERLSGLLDGYDKSNLEDDLLKARAAVLLVRMYLEDRTTKPDEALAVLIRYESLWQDGAIDAAIRAKALYYRVAAYEALGRPSEAVEALAADLREYADEGYLVHAALKALTGLRESFFQAAC